MANIKARRKLSDLYKRGVEVRFGRGPDGNPVGKIAPKGEGLFLDEDGSPLPVGDDEVQVWLQVPSSLQREMSMRDAQAARAKSLVRAKRDEGSEEHLTIMAFLADMSDETLIEYVLVQDRDTRRQDAMREVLADDEWKDITAYQDALRQYEESGQSFEELMEDPEYVALMEVDSKFGNQVAEREVSMMDTQREALKMQLEAGRGNVERKALAKRAELVGTQAFMAEYERQMMFYSVREIDDNNALFFESAREMANQDEEMLRTFQEALAPFISDSTEAKNLQGVASGSGSSELPSEPETSEASTPETANA